MEKSKYFVFQKQKLRADRSSPASASKRAEASAPSSACTRRARSPGGAAAGSIPEGPCSPIWPAKHGAELQAGPARPPPPGAAIPSPRGHLPRRRPPLSAQPSPPAQASPLHAISPARPSPLRAAISPAQASPLRAAISPARPDCPARPSPFAGGRFCRFPARGQPVLCRRPAAQRKRPAFRAGRFLSAYQNSEALTETA